MLIETSKYQFQYTIYKDKAKAHYLGVKRGFQKQGVGREVVLEFIEKCKSLGVKRIEIDCYSQSKGFWEKLGFVIKREAQVINGHLQDYHDGHYDVQQH